MKKELLDIRNIVIKEYKQGNEIDIILNKYAISFSEFYNLIAPCLEHNKNNIKDEEILEMQQMYLNNMSSTRIGVILGIHHKTICEILKEQKLIINRSRSLRKYVLDERYFDEINTPNKAYILGLLYADGYNSEDKRTIRLQLQEKDFKILEDIRNEINYSKPLSFVQCDDKIASNGFISCNMYRLDIFSAYMSQSLANVGMKQNKSLILTFPSSLTPNLYSHFLRGYFDGDGSYVHLNSSKYGSRDLVTFTSTEQFCQKAKEIINQYSLAQGGGIYDASCHNGVTRTLNFAGATQVKNLLDWLYKDAELYIERKHDLYMKNFYQ